MDFEAMMSLDGEASPVSARAIEAMETDDAAAFESALADGLDLKETDWMGASWLNRALQGRALRVADRLMELGLDPLQTDETNRDGLLNALNDEESEKRCLAIWDRISDRAPLGHERASRYALMAIKRGYEALALAAIEAGPVDVDALNALTEADNHALDLDGLRERQSVSALGMAASHGSAGLFKALLDKSDPSFTLSDPGAAALELALRSGDSAKAELLSRRAHEADPEAARALFERAWSEASKRPAGMGVGERARDRLIELGLASGEASERRWTREEAIARVREATTIPETLDLAAKFLGAERCAWGDELRGCDEALSFWRRCFFWVAAGDRGSSGSYRKEAKAPFTGAQTLERSVECAKAMLSALLAPVGMDAETAQKAAGIKARAAFFAGAPKDLGLSADDQRRIAFDPFDETLEGHFMPERSKSWAELERLASLGELNAFNPTQSEATLEVDSVQRFSDRFGLGGVRACARGGWREAAEAIEREMETFEAMSQRLPIAPERMGFGALQLAPGLSTPSCMRGYFGRVMREIPVITSTTLVEGESLRERSRILGHEYGHILDFWSKDNPHTGFAAAMIELKETLVAGAQSPESGRMWAEKGWSKAVAGAAAKLGEITEPEMASFSAQARLMAERARSQRLPAHEALAGFANREGLLAAHEQFMERLERLAKRPDLSVFRHAANDKDRLEKIRLRRYESRSTEMAARCFEALYAEPDPDRLPVGPEWDRAAQKLDTALRAFNDDAGPAASPPNLASKVRSRRSTGVKGSRVAAGVKAG